MSRIRFEWNIEAQVVDVADSEDPHLRLRRRRTILRLALLVGLLLALIGLGAFAVRQRLADVRNQYAQLLQDTVKAEVAALRIGDLSSWMQLQSGENDEWISRQRNQFLQYATLKAQATIELTGSIVGVTIDETRARVQVLETISGIPYVRLWFYERSEGGWLHVAPDFAFWGDARQVTGEGVSIRYRAADEQFARQLGDVLVAGRARSCRFLDCSALPSIQVDIAPDAAEEVAWADERNLQLLLRSPYVDIARADLPFDGSLRIQVSSLIARRLAQAHSGLQSAAYPHDAFFLFEAAIAWLGDTLVGSETSGRLVPSLAQNYGDRRVAQLLTEVNPRDDMSILQQVVPVTLESAELDWRDFIAWRLQTETELVASRAESDWLRLYDTSDESVRIAAYQRFSNNAPMQLQEVIDFIILTSDAGMPQLQANVVFADGNVDAAESVLFNLVNNVWKRAS